MDYASIERTRKANAMNICICTHIYIYMYLYIYIYIYYMQGRQTLLFIYLAGAPVSFFWHPRPPDAELKVLWACWRRDSLQQNYIYTYIYIEEERVYKYYTPPMHVYVCIHMHLYIYIYMCIQTCGYTYLNRSRVRRPPQTPPQVFTEQPLQGPRQDQAGSRSPETEAPIHDGRMRAG